MEGGGEGESEGEGEGESEICVGGVGYGEDRFVTNLLPGYY